MSNFTAKNSVTEFEDPFVQRNKVSNFLCIFSKKVLLFRSLQEVNQGQGVNTIR